MRCRYPIAMSCIGDMEELRRTPGRPALVSLYVEAVNAAKSHYANMHVYPYTYLGAYYYRHRQFQQALGAWADAADVISK